MVDVSVRFVNQKAPFSDRAALPCPFRNDDDRSRLSGRARVKWSFGVFRRFNQRSEDSSLSIVAVFRLS